VTKLTCWLLVAAVALLPFGRLIEAPLGLLAILGLYLSVSGKINHRAPALLALLVLYAAFTLPMLLSLFDAVAPAKSALSTLGSIRYLFLCVALLHVTGLAARPVTSSTPTTMAQSTSFDAVLPWVAGIVIVWCLDAGLQFFTGNNLLGYVANRGYINGLFGQDDNLKLAFALAIFFPWVVVWGNKHLPNWALGLLLALLVAVVILSGKRVAWLTVLVESLCLIVYYLRTGAIRKRMVLLGSLVLMIGSIGLYQNSQWVEQRTDTVVHALSAPNYTSVNQALSFRLPIWEAALVMIGDNWINGVGPRGFRYAYGDYAVSGDRWAKPMPGGSAGARVAHSHQLLLEVGAETGVIGIAGLILLMAYLLRLWWRTTAAGREAALPYGVSLFGMLFPINSHGAWYSSWSALLLWLMIGLYLGALYQAGDPGLAGQDQRR